MFAEFEEAVNSIDTLQKELNEIRGSLDIEALEKKLEEFENKMQELDFWNDSRNAQGITQEAKLIKDKIENFYSLKNRLEDVKVLIELSSLDEDENIKSEVIGELKLLSKDLEKLRIEIMLSGEYDRDNAILNLHAGAGGTDAQDWTEMLLRMYTRWCINKGYKIETIDFEPGDEAGIKGTAVRVIGEFAYGYLKAEKGIHRLVRISPFNSAGKRQTSFASVEVLPELTDEQDIEIRPEDLKIDTYRAGGAGGQYVNKTESAIRITHIPTGIVVQCQNERSQHSNKETAMKMLKGKLIELKERAHKEKVEDLTGELRDIGWGSQIRSYVFQPYTMVKDHRTNAEAGNIGAVMDGDIDIFINEYLKQSSNGKLEL
ncbi:peptide chain release factor 2 [Candidatus Clostridium stratigraminis]|uniref:Peptide chain release factor 2 n=1 Tax=Candidatus Clostridium stratigraminis TaxID=3381661 RepID=A0ABW8T454_9CLOT